MVMKVDYIFAYKGKVIPVEAKAGLNVHAQSLKVFRQKYGPQAAIRTSLKSFRIDNGLINQPLYEMRNLKNVLDDI